MPTPTAISGTLDPGISTSVTVRVDAFGSNRGVAVTNRSDGGTIWVRLDGVEPTIEGNDCFPVLAVREFSTPSGTTEATVILLSNDPLSYTVEGTS